MEQTRAAITQNLAERLCWHAARRDDARVACTANSSSTGSTDWTKGRCWMVSSTSCTSWESSTG